MDTTKSINWAEMPTDQAKQLLLNMSTIDRLEAMEDAPTIGNLYEHLRKLSSKELIQMYMNARITCAMCGGHAKANANFIQTQYLRELIEWYNLPVPNDDICFIMGEFNSIGSK
jgi:hypothetical protein